MFAVAAGFVSDLRQPAERLAAGREGVDGVPRLALDGDPLGYGHFTEDVYYFDGQPTRYVLKNTPLPETPFGGSVQLQVTRVNDGNGFFSGFTASSFFVGSPPPGNGAWSNDIGIVTFDGANPNASKHAFSSLDSDRAYVLRMGGGLRVWRTLWASFLVAFRDGQPFAFSEAAIENGQLATWQARSRGSPLKGTPPLLGWREDFQCVIDLQLNTTLRSAAAGRCAPSCSSPTRST